MYLKRLNSIKSSIAGDLNPLLKKEKHIKKRGIEIPLYIINL